MLLFCTLGCDCGCAGGCGFGVEVGAARVEDFAFGVEFVYQGDAGGDVEFGDVGVGDIVQVLHEGTEGVTVCCHENGFAGQDSGEDFFFKVGDEADDYVFQAFGCRYFAEVSVAGVVCLGVGAVFFDGWRRGVVGAAPCHELVIAVFFFGFCLVKSLQCTVVAFVETPIADDGDPEEVCFV